MKKLNLLFGILLFMLFSCSKKKENTVEVVKEEKKVVKKDVCADTTHWAYHSGKNGPENWKNLCESFSDCGGTSQSPIDIVTKGIESRGKSKLSFNYPLLDIERKNLEHTVQFNLVKEQAVKKGEAEFKKENKERGGFEIDGKKYHLLQFHFHALSEHTIDGKHFPIEMHLVHKYSDTDYAVIAVMVKEGKEFPLLNEKVGTLLKKYDVASFLPKSKSFYNYKGSLTTPPCSEVVNWYVLKEPITASAKQIKRLSSMLKNNYRPIQALNGRKIVSFE